MSHDISFYRMTQVLYFQHYWFITVFFRHRFDYPEGNSFYLMKSDVEALLSACKKVMEDHSLAEELLPLDGYGMDRYDEVYFQKVENAEKYIREKLLPVFDTLEGDIIEFSLSA